MTETFNCPNCRASLNFDAQKPTLTVHCDYCGSTVIVPESLRGSDAESASESEQAKKMAQVAQLVHDGHKVQAVKLVRETFGVGLKEAKDMVDALEQHEVIRLGDAKFEISTVDDDNTMEVTGSTSRGWIIGCVVAIVVVTAIIGIIGPILGGGLAIFGVFGAERAIEAVNSPTTIPSTPILEMTPTPGLASEVSRFGGQEGSGPGFFDDTRWNGVDGEGRIYTGDYIGGRVQIFDRQGKFIDMWQADIDSPMTALAVDRDGVVYLIQNREIQKYDGLTGEPLGPMVYSGRSEFEALAVAPDGSLVAVNDAGLVRFDRQGNITLDAIDVIRDLPDYPILVDDLAMDGAGNIYVVGNYTIYRFDPNGNFVDRIGGRGEERGQFQRSPDAIAVDGQGRLFVKSDDILIFDPDGRYLDRVESVPQTFSMVFNDQNQLVLMARNDNQVVVYELNR